MVYLSWYFDDFFFGDIMITLYIILFSICLKSIEDIEFRVLAQDERRCSTRCTWPSSLEMLSLSKPSLKPVPTRRRGANHRNGQDWGRARHKQGKSGQRIFEVLSWSPQGGDTTKTSNVFELNVFIKSLWTSTNHFPVSFVGASGRCPWVSALGQGLPRAKVV